MDVQLTASDYVLNISANKRELQELGYLVSLYIDNENILRAIIPPGVS
jgi:hypothetical protein